MKRRSFLKVLGAGAAATPLMARTPIGPMKRGGGSLKKLVVIFLRGGNDAVNTIVPVDPTEFALYQGHRPNIGFTQGQLLSINGTSYFAANPALAPLVNIANTTGDVSFIHCVGYPNPDRSHFESESFYETAVPGNGLLDGWLNRYLQNTAGPGLVRGIAVGWNQMQSVLGPIPIPISTNFGEISIEDDTGAGGSITQQLQNIYASTPTAGNTSVYQTGSQIFQMISSFANRDLSDYLDQGSLVHIENGATYPNSSLGSRMMHVAQMFKDDTEFLGVEVATLDHGGFDTHSQQIGAGPADANGNHYQILNNLASAMAAFYTDMGPTRMQDICVVAVSEFGRQVPENDSSGTDHGIGGVAIVMAPGVSTTSLGGGGTWPGLNNLIGNNDSLGWVHDYRDIYWEILTRHMGLDTPTTQAIVPGHIYTPLNFLT